MLNISNTKDISNLIELERISLLSTLDIQKSLNKQVLVFMKKFMNTIDFSDAQNSTCENFTYLSESTCSLEKTNENIELLNELLENLSNIDVSSKKIDELVENYNAKLKDSMALIYANTDEIEKFIHKTSVNDSSEILNEEKQKDVQNASIEIQENTLIISSTQGKVILPYTLKNIEKILRKSSDYSTCEDVINSLYTKPINYYKFSSIARFKEAYKLVREKEKGSFLKALGLALELFGNYNLHPAIITACDTLDQLDVYLACLDENKLSEFNFFTIKYEIPLTAI